MGCAASAEGQHTNTAGRPDDSQIKQDTKKPDPAAQPTTTQQPNVNETPATKEVATKPPDTSNPPPIAPPALPPTIAGYPVNTYTDGTTRVAVKCVILSRQKCESVCRFLDSVRKARDRNGGYFRNPEEPLEMDMRRETDTASAASNRSKMESIMPGHHNNSVSGHGMNMSMAVHVGQAEALSPSPHGALATVPDISSGNTPGKTHQPLDRPTHHEKAQAATNEPVAAPGTGRQPAGEPIPGSVDVDGPM